MLNVRLDKEIEKMLNTYSQQKNITKSSIVKEALVAYLSKHQNDDSPYELGKDLFGIDGSGDTTASTTYKTKIKKKLNEKHSH
ncbi:CopG family transcriptional regulator [Fulvivirga sp.]|jgi:predicted DNA-binding protein|uniref:CopG family transcriptional regulator n=1 Tax=Fulvivirga sp. TaxID=1931237 RepID=UPI0032EDECCD